MSEHLLDFDSPEAGHNEMIPVLRQYSASAAAR